MFIQSRDVYHNSCPMVSGLHFEILVVHFRSLQCKLGEISPKKISPRSTYWFSKPKNILAMETQKNNVNEIQLMDIAKVACSSVESASVLLGIYVVVPRRLWPAGILPMCASQLVHTWVRSTVIYNFLIEENWELLTASAQKATSQSDTGRLPLSLWLGVGEITCLHFVFSFL